MSDSLVFASNRTTSSGHRYADIEGVQYEYPRAYRNQIQPGRRFLYYRSREGVSQPQYFGVGIVGDVTPSADADRLICAILDFQPFEPPIPFRDASGSYLESGGVTRGYYQRGVRTISDADFDRIVALAGASTTPAAVSPTQTAPGRGYATSEHAQMVEAVSMEIVEAGLAHRYVGRAVRRMPHSNPGYDIEVGPVEAIERFVEVKGTVARYVDFFISEGERTFSVAHTDRYTLAVVHSIVLGARSGTIVWFDGEIDARFELEPTQWRAKQRQAT